ncbi:hypothetical protein [Leuconostoc mesenteroides]|uniref:hypothetical protein n=1 Tax=Leuconostoc mesenteroides TaxID=1245 RepID=UPI0010ADC805|nr:hypothetical protein [Leuconostoc mesenteroides]TJY27393.1 hypothetical protein FCF26_09600 [Leuconostoc mesenteroides subsp. mesenteroides]
MDTVISNSDSSQSGLSFVSSPYNNHNNGHPYIAALLVSSAFAYTLSNNVNEKVQNLKTSQSINLYSPVNESIQAESKKIVRFDNSETIGKVEVIKLNNDSVEYGKLIQKLDDLQQSVSENKQDIRGDIKEIKNDFDDYTKKAPTKDYISAEINKAKLKAIIWIVGLSVPLITLISHFWK